MPETHIENVLDPQNPLFCVKDKNLYIWAYIHANNQDFWKSLNGSDNTKQKMWLKMPKNHFIKTQRVDLKVWADSSWLLVFKNGIKKCFSLNNGSVIDVWSQCKKHDERGAEGKDQLFFFFFFFFF